MSLINKKAPDFEADAYFDFDIVKVRLSDYAGKWVVLMFYPADFTFVCPTEIGEMADNYDEMKQLNTEVLSISTDTAFVHYAWHSQSETIKKIRFPMVADPGGRICRAYDTYMDAEGLSQRATFIIDPDGIVKAVEMHDNSIGRSAKEIIRKLQAAQYVKAHPGNVCPASWEPGQATLKPGNDLIGKI